MKYLYTALILVFMSQGGATAQEKKSGFFDKVKTTFSSEIKIGTHTFKDGSVYTGEMKGRKPNGKGKTVFKNGNVYEGEYVKGNVKDMVLIHFLTAKSTKDNGFRTSNTVRVSTIS